MTNAEHFATTILYVDDEEMACKYFARMLETEFNVITASGVDEALEILEREYVGVLVTDYRMKGKDGGDLLREVALSFPHLVCILVTAYANKDVLLDTVNASEIFRILEKPLDANQIREVLHLATNLARDRATHKQRLVAINETLAFLSHELNTPLATISNYAHHLKNRVAEVSPKVAELTEIESAIAAMQNNARYCMKVIATLTASAQSADNLPNTHAEISAHKLVASLIDTFPLTPTQRSFIHINVDEDFIVKALSNIVSLVLSSILNNSLRALQDQAAPKLGISIFVNNNIPQIVIADNGCGIAPEILARLLTEQVTTHANDGGSGWGLILCKRIMQAFSGNIVIHSELGQGTTVTLSFPAIKI
ncbi:MAG: hybrid sensor histidine kinase/response regulator [Cellvibrio sp.]